MQPEREQQWPDSDGTPVAVGDWIQVWCSWTGELKFEGRPVQIMDVLAGRAQTVFRLRDPSSESHHYMPTALGSFRRVSNPVRQSGVFARADLDERKPASTRPSGCPARFVRSPA